MANQLNLTRNDLASFLKNHQQIKQFEDLFATVNSSPINVNSITAQNDEPFALNIGDVVYISGSDGANLLVKLAQANTIATSESTIGIVAETIAIGTVGKVVTNSTLTPMDTSGFNNGDLLYLSPSVPGGITNIKPTSPSLLVHLGYCVESNSINGNIYVSIINNVNIDDLNDITITPPVLDGSLLIYSATIPSWINALLSAGAGITITNGPGSISISSNLIAGANITITVVGTAYQIAVSGLGTMAFENIGITTTFLTGGIPTRTVTVTNGIIQSVV